MKKGTRVVSVAMKNGFCVRGVTVADEDNGKILVAVDSEEHQASGEVRSFEKHHVIWCNVTWLSAVA